MVVFRRKWRLAALVPVMLLHPVLGHTLISEGSTWQYTTNSTKKKKQEPSARRNWLSLDGLDGGSCWLPLWRKDQVKINPMCIDWVFSSFQSLHQPNICEVRSPCKGKRKKRKRGNIFWKKNDAEVSHKASHTTAAAFDRGRCSCQPASAATHCCLI